MYVDLTVEHEKP